jgi:tetratricopeptide (TPR) repeat protein
MLSPGERFRDQRLASLLHLAGTEFRVLKVLQGGMASVAMVEGENARVCALKFLDLRSADSDTIERFRREVQVWVTAASCDAVVQVLGTLRIDEAPVVCAEWMSGGDLSRVMNSGDPRVFYSVIDRIAAGLEWVHEKYKVIHRDLKPSNILLNNKGDAFISDWGIGKVALEAEKLKARIHPSEKRTSIVQAPLTETGQVVGTITYCSPEQILSSSEVDFRSDIYSLGCLMFEWEVGTPPFVDVSWEEIARKHLESAPPKIAGAFRKSKFGADSVIHGCLQKSPDQRFGSYKDLRNALRSQAARKGITYPLAQVGGRNMPLVGYGEILGLKPKVVGTKGWGLIEYEAAEGYVAEAEALMSVGEWNKAYDILVRFWVPDFYPEGVRFNVAYAVCLALCLTKLSRSEEAVEVLKTIPESQRSAEVFVNWSDALNHLNLFSQSESIAKRGLTSYPEDCDLLGNLTIALTFQGKHREALPIATKRLALERSLHSLEEAASVTKSLGMDLFHSDFPKAMNHLSSAAELLAEAQSLNPQYAVVRLSLAQTLFAMELYSEALDIASKLPGGPIFGVGHAVLHAESLNRVGSAIECLKLCAECKKHFPSETRLLRVESETIADFYFVGKDTKDGKKVVVSECLDFFTTIVADEKRRQLSDFGYIARIEDWLDSSERAMTFAKQAHSIYGDRWEIFFSYAFLMGRAGDWQSAYLNSKTACELAPWHAPVWNLRKWIEENLGMVDASRLSERHKQDLHNKMKGIKSAVRERFRSSGIID